MAKSCIYKHSDPSIEVMQGWIRKELTKKQIREMTGMGYEKLIRLEREYNIKFKTTYNRKYSCGGRIREKKSVSRVKEPTKIHIPGINMEFRPYYGQ